MSRRIPLFPLPGVVLPPGTLLPLHIFEPRYRAMVADALAGNRTIGMALLAEGSDPREAAPLIHPVGGAGRIVEVEELEDGRYNLVLQAEFRYRVLTEAPPDPYRVAEVAELPSIPFPDARQEQSAVRIATETFLEIARDLGLPPLPDPPLSTERLASELALRLRYTPEELQEVLETDALAGRYGTLIGRMVEWKRRTQLLAPFRPAELDVTRN
ncbi:MAG TPA: LON peptidase substrate-binding domain-containing protein [Thermoanaerobaculia bacterium]